jgi:hypothetical protein
MRMKISLGIKYPSGDHGSGVYSITFKLKFPTDRYRLGRSFGCLSHRDF